MSLFRDAANEVRRAAGDALVEFARRNPDIAVEVLASLAEACCDADLHGVDNDDGRPGWDYAYDSLWTTTEILVSRA
jgi:hypothetical protein